jgi:hypothetical protein
MSNNDQNQQKYKQEDEEIINLYELQPELIAAKRILAKVLKRLCTDDKLMQKVYKSSGDSSTTIIWYLQQVIKYLEVIIAINQKILSV